MGYIGLYRVILGNIGLYRDILGYIGDILVGIMEKKMETTI